MKFLTDQFDQGLQYRTVNTLSLTISMTYPDVNSCPVRIHHLLCRLLKGTFNSHPPAPHYSASWDFGKWLTTLVRVALTACPCWFWQKKFATLMALTGVLIWWHWIRIMCKRALQEPNSVHKNKEIRSSWPGLCVTTTQGNHNHNLSFND